MNTRRASIRRRAGMALCLLLAALPLHAASRDCTASVIMGNGPQSSAQKCRPGDIVKLSIRRIAELCDFDDAIVCYGEGKRSLCYCRLLKSPRKPR